MAQIQIVDSNNSPVTAALVTNTGATTDANSLPVVLSNESKALLTAIATQLTTLVVPGMNSGSNLSVATSGAGSAYVTFASTTCKQLTIVNHTAAQLEVQQGAAGVGLIMLAFTERTFFGLSNANQLGVRRLDQSTTSLTITARAEG